VRFLPRVYDGASESAEPRHGESLTQPGRTDTNTPIRAVARIGVLRSGVRTVRYGSTKDRVRKSRILRYAKETYCCFAGSAVASGAAVVAMGVCSGVSSGCSGVLSLSCTRSPGARVSR
jgi:hypothetical protein